LREKEKIEIEAQLIILKKGLRILKHKEEKKKRKKNKK